MGHTHRCQLAFKKKSPSPESCVPETGSDPPIGSGRDSGRDRETVLKIKSCLGLQSCRGLDSQTQSAKIQKCLKYEIT